MVRRLQKEDLERRIKYGSRQRMITVVWVGAPLCILAGLFALAVGIPHLQDLLEGTVQVGKTRQITRRLVVLAFSGAGLALVLWGCFLIPRSLRLYRKYK